MLVDSHCHLHLLTPDQGSLNDVVQRAKENGVQYLLNVCVSLSDLPVLLKLANDFTNVGASVGLHPNEQDETVETDTLVQLAQHQKVIAIGETGLDYFRSTGDLKWQQDRFRFHIEAAKRVKKPLIVHTRDAKQDTIKILREEKADQVGGVIHCFTEDAEMAKQALDLGFYISFSGIVTFKNAVSIQEAAKIVPLDRLLIETDSPYLAPVPFRGKPNEPAYVRYTAEYLAGLKNIPFETFAEMTTNNFFHLFNGAVRPHV